MNEFEMEYVVGRNGDLFWGYFPVIDLPDVMNLTKTKINLPETEINYNNSSFKETEGMCIICLEEGTVFYSCHEIHAYHKECLNSWVKESRSINCCVCKKSLNGNGNRN